MNLQTLTTTFDVEIVSVDYEAGVAVVAMTIDGSNVIRLLYIGDVAD